MMTGWTDPAYEAVARWLQVNTGLTFAPHRCEDVEAGIRRAMRKAGITDIAACQAMVGVSRLPLDDLIAELTVGETYFFRDPAQFDFIRRQLLPDIRRRHGAGHPVRAWSAGCASGEEAYSLAILFEEEAVSGSSTILATDISRTALARARAATYGPWSLRGDNGTLAGRYFRRKGDRFALADRFRQRVNFEYLNLALDHYPSLASGAWGMDMILCRNVLIYFERPTIARVIRNLLSSLAEGGLLITGASDPLYQEGGPYETVVTSAGVFYRRTRDTSTSIFLQGSVEDTGPSVDTPLPDLPARRQEATATRSDVSEAEPAGLDNNPLNRPREAAGWGDHARVADLTRRPGTDPAAANLHIHALANLGDASAAEAAAAIAVADHPLSTELHFTHAMLLMGLDRYEQAAQALRRVLYLDRSLAAAHFVLGSVLRRLGDLDGARRAYRAGEDLAAAQAPDQPVPLSDGESAGRLAAAAHAQLALLSGEPGGGR